MISLAESAAAALFAFASIIAPIPDRDAHEDHARAAVTDTVVVTGWMEQRAVALAPLPAQDTIPRRRRVAVDYSEGYGRRLTLHRRLSYAMLPLFAASYFSGDQLFQKGREAPGWARSTHRPAATGAAVLFGANTVTGAWNLWEGRRDPNGRTRRLLHAALFTGASAGFTYAGAVLAEEAERSGEKRRQHRAVNLTSMGVATASWLLMLVNR